MKNIILGVFLSILSLFNIIISINSTSDILLLASSTVSSILLLFILKQITGDIFNMINFFAIFMILYGLSGPTQIVFKGGINNIFTGSYNLNSYFIGYNLAIIGFVLSICIFYKNSNKKIDIDIDENKLILYIKVANLMAFAVGFMAIIDFVRVGGMSTLMYGKALYQQNLANLSITLPTSELCRISLAIITCSLAVGRKYNFNLRYRKYIVQTFIGLSPYLATLFILGNRGPLVSIMFILLIGITYIHLYKNIKMKQVAVLLVAYLIMGLVYLNRAQLPYALATGDWDGVVSNLSNKEKIVSSLMPGENEFGVGFGNFNEYYIYDNKSLGWGKSYIRDLCVIIPGFLYPGEKPKSITYEFRDEFFYHESSRSSIAGTAFSSMLEAYMNFGMVGIFFMYFLFGYLLTIIENVRKISGSYWFMIIYVYSFGAITMSFHRSQFADIVGNIVYGCIYVFIYKIIASYLRATKLA